ncbi:MAG: phage head morphogenesis protein [Acidiphilium sp.]
MPSTAEAVRLPFKEAVDYFRQKASVPSAHWTAVMDEAHARSFAVAGATDKALIEDLRGAVDKAIAEGTGLGAFQKEFDAIVAKRGWVHHGHPQWRARVIYESNMRTAFAAGRYAQATDPDVLAAFPYWEWVHTPVQHPRPQHVAWDGLVLRADDPFWDTHYPPCGYGCMCIVRSLSEGDLRRRGKSGPDASPKIEWREYVNKTTGLVTKVPTGVDPGWAYNPGKVWKMGAKAPVTAAKVRAVGEAPPVLALPGERAVSPATIEAFLAKPQGSIQVGTLPGELRATLGAKDGGVLLSADTMRKQLGERPESGAGHPELEEADYLALPALLAAPDLVLSDRALHIVLLKRAEKTLRATVKVTGDQRECYLVSLRAARDADVARDLRRGVVIAGDAGKWTRR